MIFRIFSVRAAFGRERDWQERVERISMPWLKSLPGLGAYRAGRPPQGSGERTFTMAMLFESIATLQAAVGEVGRAPVLLGEEVALGESANVEQLEQFG